MKYNKYNYELSLFLVPSRKRNDNNQSRQRDDERQKKKIKRE
jgi:hypothetical protein